MAWRRSMLAVAVVAGFLGACSSSGDDASPDTTTVASPAPSTTDTPATTAGAAAPTTQAPTTQAPTTTIDPAEALAAEVEADLLEAFGLGWEALQDPFDAEKEQAALDRRLGVIAENLIASLAEFRANNYAIRPNGEFPASVTIESPPRFFGTVNEVAEVQICDVNSWILVEVSAGPNGTDAIVNPDVVASRATIFMRNSEGTWRFEGSSLISEWEGSTACASE